MVLKERQFYNLSTRKNEMVPAQYIEIVKYKNGAHALVGLSRENMKMFKLVKENSVPKLEKKYGKAKRYRR